MDMIQPRLLREEVYELIWKKIMTGDFRPGDRIVESRLAKQLSVSQAPVREALQQLAREGLVATLARSGTFVREIDADEMRDVYAVRTALESMAIELVLGQPVDRRDASTLASICDEMLEAALRDDSAALVESDMRFHLEIMRLSGNRALAHTAGPLLSQTSAFTSITNLVYFQSLTEIAQSHLPLLELVQSGTETSVGKAAIRQHLWDVWSRLEGDAVPTPTGSEDSPGEGR